MGWAARANGSDEIARAAGYRKPTPVRPLKVWSIKDINRALNNEFQLGRTRVQVTQKTVG